MSDSKRIIKKIFTCLLVIGVFVLSSCSKSPDGKAPESAKSPAVESLFAVQINNFEFTLSQIDKYLMGVSPIPMGLQMIVRMQLAGVLDDPQLTGLNMAGTVGVFGVLLPAKTESDPPLSRILVAGMVPVSDYDGFVSGHKNIGEADENGVSKLTASLGMPGMAPGAAPSGPTVLLAKLGDYAVVGWGNDYDKIIEYKKLMGPAAAKSAGVAQLAGVTDASGLQAKDPICIYGNIQAASEAFGPLLLGKIEEFKNMLTQMNPPAQGQMMNMNAVMDMYAGLLETTMKEVKSFNVAIKPNPDVLLISETVSAVPGTGTAEMFASAQGSRKENELLGYLEDGSAMNFAFKVNTPFWEKLTEVGLDLLGKLSWQSLSADNAAKMKKLTTDMMASMGGSAAGTFRMDSAKQPMFNMKYVIAVSDPAKFKSLVAESAEMFEATGVKDLYKGLGMELDYTMTPNTSTYKDVSIDSAKLVLKPTEPNSPPGQMIKAMYGDGIDYRWGVTDGICSIAIGDNVDAAVQELIDKVKAGGAKELCGEIKSAMEMLPDAKNGDFFLTYNYVRILNMVGGMMPAMVPAGMDVPMPKLDINVPTKSNLAIAGKIGGGKIFVDIAIPKQHLSEIVMALMQMQQQMQKQQLKGNTTRAQIRLIENGLERFALECGRYPSDSEGLEALLVCPKDLEGKWGGPYLKQSELNDPWGNAYIYVEEGAINTGSYDIISYGADGKAGGEGENQDILND
ncbi:MAG: type II secretion system protein GspG [Sedimentisphaerales bacterium]|nr:type II secretion system protein GspG [Sedimentisphaerales bacterium]